MKKYIVLLSVLFVNVGFSQTKLIAFKSHSGKMINFEKALAISEFGSAFHNLGMAPEPTITSAELNAVVFVSDSVAVMLTSQVCKKSQWYYGNDTTIDFNAKTIWSAGADTVINHPLFSKQHSLDSIKEVLKNDYYFRNDVDSIKFVGYDNGLNHQENSEEKAPIISNDFPNEPNGPWMLMVFIALFAVFLGLISWRISQIKKDPSIKSV